MHPSVPRAARTEGAGAFRCLETFTINSVAIAALKHRLADNMRWQAGMLALPCHDAPWWWTD